MTNQLFIKILRRRILDPAAELLHAVDHSHLLAHHINENVRRQAIFGVVDPLEYVRILQACHTAGHAPVVDLRGGVRHHILALVLRQRAQLLVRQGLGPRGVDPGHLIIADVGEIPVKVAVLHRHQVAVSGSTEDGGTHQEAHQHHHSDHRHNNHRNQSLFLHIFQTLRLLVGPAHQEKGPGKYRHQQNQKQIQLGVVHIQCRQHHIIGNAAHHRGDQGAQQQPQGHFARLDHRLHFISLGPRKLGLKIV